MESICPLLVARECPDMNFSNLPAEWPNSVKQAIEKAFSNSRLSAIRNALDAVESLTPTLRGRPFKLGIVRTFTLETQLDGILLALSTIPCAPAILLGDLDNIEQILLTSKSRIMVAGPDALLAIWRLEELAPDIVFTPNAIKPDQRARIISEVIDRISYLCDHYRRSGLAPLFLSTLPEPVAIATDQAEIHQPFGWHEALLRINQTILAEAAKPGNIYVFDFASWASTQGHSAFDQKMDLFARQPIASMSLLSLGNAIARCMRPLLVPSSKVLAVDLDNLLWGGVVGEDGINGLKIGHDYPGNVYRLIQKTLLNLKSRGILLVLLSKNNHQDVVEAFSTLPDMPLALSDFAAMKINWQPKHDNLMEIAKSLNLGLDSFVFADDQIFEREQMAFHLPQVKILPLSEDPLQILRTLTSCWYFDTHRVSYEDITRAEDYAAQARRQEVETNSKGPEQFLQNLGLKAVVQSVSEETLQRTFQMLAKTNQFNVTSRRHSEAVLRGMKADPSNLLITLSLSDRFSEQGIVGLIIGIRGKSSDEMIIDSFLLSCRALGRGAEQVLWRTLVKKAHNLNYRRINATYLRTSKNSQVADLFDQLGMKLIEHEAERSIYRLEISEVVSFPSWITVTDKVNQ